MPTVERVSSSYYRPWRLLSWRTRPALPTSPTSKLWNHCRKFVGLSSALPCPEGAETVANQRGGGPSHMARAKVTVITSGKGGVGKTTSAASIAAGLALRGQKTAVIDFDVGLRNLDLVMGCERRVVYDLVNVVQGRGHGAPGADQGQARREPVRAARVADARQGRARHRRHRPRARGARGDGLRAHRVRLARRHREGRAGRDVLRRRGDRRDQSRGQLGARLATASSACSTPRPGAR